MTGDTDRATKLLQKIIIGNSQTVNLLQMHADRYGHVSISSSSSSGKLLFRNDWQAHGQTSPQLSYRDGVQTEKEKEKESKKKVLVLA